MSYTAPASIKTFYLQELREIYKQCEALQLSFRAGSGKDAELRASVVAKLEILVSDKKLCLPLRDFIQYSLKNVKNLQKGTGDSSVFYFSRALKCFVYDIINVLNLFNDDLTIPKLKEEFASCSDKSIKDKFLLKLEALKSVINSPKIDIEETQRQTKGLLFSLGYCDFGISEYLKIFTRSKYTEIDQQTFDDSVAAWKEKASNIITEISAQVSENYDDTLTKFSSAILASTEDAPAPPTTSADSSDLEAVTLSQESSAQPKPSSSVVVPLSFFEQRALSPRENLLEQLGELSQNLLDEKTSSQELNLLFAKLENIFESISKDAYMPKLLRDFCGTQLKNVAEYHKGFHLVENYVVKDFLHKICVSFFSEIGKYNESLSDLSVRSKLHEVIPCFPV